MSELHLPIRPDSTALLVVDLQEKLRPVIDGREAVIENTRKLLRLAAILSMPVLATTQYEKGLGATVTGIAELLDHEPIDKVFSAAWATRCFARDSPLSSRLAAPFSCAASRHTSA